MAAAYCGGSAQWFRGKVEEGVFPKPRFTDGKALWDRVQLDAAIDMMAESVDGLPPEADDPIMAAIRNAKNAPARS
jgi:hypothetical protein